MCGAALFVRGGDGRVLPFSHMANGEVTVGQTMAVAKTQVAQTQVQDGLDFIAQRLEALGVSKKEAMRSLLIAEETMLQLVAHATDPEALIDIRVRKGCQKVVVKASLRGEEFELVRDVEVGDIFEAAQAPDSDEAVQSMLRDTLLRANTDFLRFKHAKGVNQACILVAKIRHAMAVYTLAALFAAVVVGLVMKSFVPQGVTDLLDDYIFTSISTVFLNALKMIVCPVVFFSIVTCTSQFGNVREMGRIGGKVLGFYMMTTVLAILVGAGVFFLAQPGDPSLAAGLTDDAASITATASATSVSVKDTLVGIVPSNLLKPFLEANMMQIIFVALVIGLTVGGLGTHARVLREIFEACNALFLKVTTAIVQFIPLVTFCSIISVVLKTGWDVMVSLLAMVATFVLGILVMICVYSLLLALIGRLNPLCLLVKYAPTMLQVFSMSSSSAAIVVNMDACEKRLGVPKKVYSLSIPLGATVNMDGTCIYLMVMGLALAHIFGIQITGAALLSLFFSVMVLSIGAPAVPGAGLVCLSVLLAQLGVPIEAVSLVMGIDSVLSMLRALSNCAGDVVASVVAAKTEGLLDVERYRDMHASK